MRTSQKIFCVLVTFAFAVILKYYEYSVLRKLQVEDEAAIIGAENLWRSTNNNLSKKSMIDGRKKNQRGRDINQRWQKQLLKGTTKCSGEPKVSQYEQWGNYWVLSNYLTETKSSPPCDMSVTYTTHGEFTYLYNLIEIAERWDGPISISLYTPGPDFSEALKRILHLRECHNSTKIKERVSFHLFFDDSHMPTVEIPGNPEKLMVNCSEEKTVTLENSTGSVYRSAKKLTYPINLARMIARDRATTLYVFPCDIELYPSRNLVQGFINMIKRNDKFLQNSSQQVFVLPVFEIKNGTEIPNEKKELLPLLKNGTAIPFHENWCINCHAIPKFAEWAAEKPKDIIDVFHVAKRQEKFKSWEPFFISKKFEPGFDTRLTWEGRLDKYTQAYVLCLLDYDFLILDNAFLIHKPGIKRRGPEPPLIAKLMQQKQKQFIKLKVYPELKVLYGENINC